MTTPQYSTFTVDTSSGTSPLLVQFTDTSGTNPPDSWSWDFDDGSPLDTTQSPSHVFVVAGVYNVILTVFFADTSSTIASAPTVITVSSPPPPPPPPPTFIGRKVKIQGDQIHYSSADPTSAIDVNVKGTMTVRDTINIGDTLTLEDALISTPDGSSGNSANLQITAGAYGLLKLNQNPTGGAILLNNVQWPAGVVIPNPGMYVGSSSVNTLEYYPFILGVISNDALTMDDLNNTYPNAQPGQYLVSTNVMYFCYAAGLWRSIATTTPPSGS